MYDSGQCCNYWVIFTTDKGTLISTVVECNHGN